MIDIDKLIHDEMKELLRLTKDDGSIEEIEKSKARISTLKLVKADFVNREKAFDVLTETNQAKALLNMVKSREVVMEKYREGNRNDLVRKMEDEIEIIKGLLPPMPSEDDVKAATSAAIQELYTINGTDFEVSMRDLKTVIAKVQDFLPLADGGVISKAFRNHLDVK